jgi:glycosyltransferase involved in cell wall biosynthesis
MNTTSELTIVIPAKNEAELILLLLISLVQQDLPQMPNTKVYLADAASTDKTRELARHFRKWLNIEVIEGGLPAVGRNAGARSAATPYVLFIDADVEISDSTLVRRALTLLKERSLHCVTTNIACSSGGAWDRVLYSGSNIMQQLSRLYKPYSTGMFMLFDRHHFHELGGFNEQALYGEDYLLSQKVARAKFGIVQGNIQTTNRRFKKMGHLRLVRLFFGAALNTSNESYFLQDHRYWHSKA